MFELNTKDTPPLEDAVIPKKAWILNTADFATTYFVSGRKPNSYLSSIMKKPAFTIEEKNRRRREGLAPVAWIASNCKAGNRRHYYVNQLMKYIDVDIYGKCLKNKEWPKNEHGVDLSASEVVAPYKFYLAIENSNCDDYVTEKLERPFAQGVVPIVDGPKDYSPFIPTQDSVIREDDFDSPAHLATYLHQLDKDDTAYMSHLSYKFPNETYATTWTHLSPKLRETFDTGDKDSDWGYDGRGSSCKICKLTHDLAEGIITLDPKHRIPIDGTCDFGKWNKSEWAFDFWYWHIMVTLFMLTLLMVLLSNRRVRALIRNYVSMAVSKVQRFRNKQYDETTEPFIPLAHTR
ncbi:Alpha-(1,3)-fucosyltransferase 11 [Actinomortierella wolfii]|nr:Alpha-(1,3)-fucosyltransferase 11 [Actinomortierella wolfii]